VIMAALREVSRVGAEAEAVKMSADTHVAIEIVPTKEAAEMVISTEEMAVPAPDHEALIGTIVLVGIAGIEMN